MRFSGVIVFMIFVGSFNFQSCQSPQQAYLETVNGSITKQSLGVTLIHEHILVDFIGADATGYDRWDRDSVIKVVLPYLLEIKEKGVSTLVECTPAYLGRDPLLLQELSNLSGIQIITNTGYYGAVGGKYLPEHVYTESSDQLAERWIKEFEEGIEDSGIKPGFIKISVNDAPELSEIDEKLVRAAARTNIATGMAIVSHTGPWAPAEAEIKVLIEEGVSLSDFVWVHAQAEKDFSNYKKAAENGVWISLDGIAWDVSGHLERLMYAKENNLLSKILISHDAGWYSPGEPKGGDFKPFTALFDELIPLLRQNGFSQEELDLLLIENPAEVFSIGK